MPLYPPRNEPVKKKEQLVQRQKELHLAIRNNLSIYKLNKAVEKYRTAQLSLMKAKIHELKEKELQGKASTISIETIKKEISKWTNKSVQEIVNETKPEF